MNNNFNYEVNKILKNAEREMKELKHPYVGTEHLLLSLLKVECIQSITKKYHLTYSNFRQELLNIVGSSSRESEVILYTPLLRLVIDNALIIAKNNVEKLSAMHLLNSLLTSDDGIAIRLLLGMNIDIDALYNEIALSKTDTLDEIGVNLNERESSVLVGRENELTNIIEILLRKNKNNPILIGEAGVGKSAIVYELARRIREGCVPEKLQNAQIISIDMASMLSNTKYRGEFETRLNNIIKEVKKNKNIILFIDEIHTIVKSGGGEGSIDAANILKPYLASDELKVIGATTINEYERFIVKDKALSRRFASVLIKEPTHGEVINILNGVRSNYERHHHIKISDENIEDIVTLSDKYIFNNHHPDKALDVLDSVCARVALKKFNNNYEMQCNEFLKNKDYKNALKVKKISRMNEIIEITHQDIIEAIERITNIKILTKDDYLKLVNDLDTHIYGQDLTKLKSVLKKKFIGNKVLGFTIEGEKGIGKSYTAKVIADSLSYNYIEIDMATMSNMSISRIIGSDPGYVGYEDETILDKVKYFPYSLILLKNIEMGASNIKSLFSSIIQNGQIKDNRGDTINFNNAIIVMTSNVTKNSIGYNSIDEDTNDSIIHYDLIKKDDLVNCEKYTNIINKLNDKTTFIEINKAMDEYMYNDLVSMI